MAGDVRLANVEAARAFLSDPHSIAARGTDSDAQEAARAFLSDPRIDPIVHRRPSYQPDDKAALANADALVAACAFLDIAFQRPPDMTTAEMSATREAKARGCAGNPQSTPEEKEVKGAVGMRAIAGRKRSELVQCAGTPEKHNKRLDRQRKLRVAHEDGREGNAQPTTAQTETERAEEVHATTAWKRSKRKTCTGTPVRTEPSTVQTEAKISGELHAVAAGKKSNVAMHTGIVIDVATSPDAMSDDPLGYDSDCVSDFSSDAACRSLDQRLAEALFTNELFTQRSVENEHSAFGELPPTPNGGNPESPGCFQPTTPPGSPFDFQCPRVLRMAVPSSVTPQGACSPHTQAVVTKPPMTPSGENVPVTQHSEPGAAFVGSLIDDVFGSAPTGLLGAIAREYRTRFGDAIVLDMQAEPSEDVDIPNLKKRIVENQYMLQDCISRHDARQSADWTV